VSTEVISNKIDCYNSCRDGQVRKDREVISGIYRS